MNRIGACKIHSAYLVSTWLDSQEPIRWLSGIAFFDCYCPVISNANSGRVDLVIGGLEGVSQGG
jgi:hypothetical protein